MKILCAVDGSKHSRWALETLQRWSFPQGSSLVLVHILDIAKLRAPKGLGESARAAMERAASLAKKIGLDMLKRMEAKLRALWKTVERRIVRGHPAETIVRTAVRQKTDLIVMGSRGQTNIRAFLLGSVSRKVVMHAECPVLLIKKPVPMLRRIVVGTDGSKDARAALDFFLQMPVPPAARFTIVTVVPPLPIEAGSEPLTLAAFLEQLRAPLAQKAKAVAQEAADRIQKAGFVATTAVVHGHPSHEIVKVAEGEHADLVVVGSRGLTGTSRFVMGSVSDGVIKYAPCAVLVFRR